MCVGGGGGGGGHAYVRTCNACHSLSRVARGSNIFIQIMVTFLSYISNACHSLSGVAERLQHTCVHAYVRMKDMCADHYPCITRAQLAYR